MANGNAAAKAGQASDEAMARLADRVNAANRIGMAPSVWAELQPDKVAVWEAGGAALTFAELNAGANRIARMIRGAGLGPGDAVALVCTNRHAFPIVIAGAFRVGVRLTPVNWHLTAEEIAYVVTDCEAKAIFVDVKVPAGAEAAELCSDLQLKVALGGSLPGFATFEAVAPTIDASDIDDPVRGSTMLYTSGTTGRPKGVYKPNVPLPVFDAEEYLNGDVHLCTGPGYHASPLLGDIRKPTLNGVATVLLDKWDSETVLQLIERHRVTRGHFVPIMFQRLLALPKEVRDRYDTSSIRRISHGAAPISPEVKRATIEWLGPVLYEYYAGSEGGVGFWVTSEEWLAKPGTVGRMPRPGAAKILDAEGNELPRGVPGYIYMSLQDQGGFSYFKSDEKTHAGRRGDFFTMGDIGYFDEDDYLFLTGRDAETIIAGGVNIYPQEIDNELIKHPAVEDSCTIGVPHEERGEEVRSVIQLRPGFEASDGLRQEILDFAAQHLAKFKMPRGIDFAEKLPRNEAGKIQRNKVRTPYWEGRARQI